jgi:hypothetical protein
MPKRTTSPATAKPSRPQSDLDDEDIQKIVSAVGDEPEGFNKYQLSYDIGFAETRYRTAIDTRSRKRRRRRLELISKSAARLKILLADDDTWTAIAPHIAQLGFEAQPENLMFSRDFPEMLVRAVSDALRPDHRFQGAADQVAHDLAKQSPFETLVGQLEKVFVKHFATRARVNRPNDRENDTPYIRFIRSVLKQLNLTYTDEAIIRATSVARSGQGRRKAA